MLASIGAFVLALALSSGFVVWDSPAPSPGVVASAVPPAPSDSGTAGHEPTPPPAAATQAAAPPESVRTPRAAAVAAVSPAPGAGRLEHAPSGTVPARAAAAGPRYDPAGVAQVSKILTNMKPAEAASILAYFNDQQAEEVLRSVPARQAATLLAELPVERAATLSRRLMLARAGVSP
jgi:hypothetical protein